MKKIYFLLLLVCLTNGINAQSPVTIVADRDNSIYSESGTASNGAGQHIFTGATAASNLRRSLIHFNLSTIPAGSVITAVSISLYANKLPPASSGPTTIELHKLLKDWGEGTSDPTNAEGQGAPATANDATWTSNLFNTSTWTAPGSDFSATKSDSALVPSIGILTFASTPALVADVQSFVNASASNFGWLIMSSAEDTANTARRFTSRTNTNAAQRPSITVTYTASLPVTLKTFSGTLQNNRALLNWQTVTELNNQYYEVEHSIDGVTFSSIGKVNGNGSSTAFHNYTFTQNNLTQGKHYYRLAQHDLDGSVRYSQIIMLSFKSNLKLQLTPNPAISFVNIASSAIVQGLAYTISSSAGQIVKKGVLNSQQIDVQKLIQGQYWLSIETLKGETLQASFIKK